MEKIELTEKEIKTLKLFSYYVQSQGCKEVYCDVYFYEAGVIDDWYLGEWYCQSDGSKIESYDSAIEVFTDIVKKIPIASYLDDEYDGKGEISISMDTNERKLDFRLYEEVQNENDMGDSKEINFEEDPEIEKFINKLKEEEVYVGKVEFNGGGDSGEVYGYLEADHTNVDLDRDIENFLYNWLENFYGGWEINEGSHGDFVFDLKENKIFLNFYEHSNERIDRGKVLHIDF